MSCDGITSVTTLYFNPHNYYSAAGYVLLLRIRWFGLQTPVNKADNDKYVYCIVIDFIATSTC